MPPSRVFPPVEFCRGTKPSQAANSRPERNTFGSATVVAIAVAMIGPMPGMLSDSTQMAIVPDVSVPQSGQKPVQEAATVPVVGLLQFGPPAPDQEAGKTPILVLLPIGESRVLSGRNLPPK